MFVKFPVAESIARSWALLDISPFVSPMTETDTMLVDTVFVISISERVSVPETDSPALVSGNTAKALSPVVTVMSGESLVPLIVIVSVVLVSAPCSSVVVVVNVSVRFSPTARA